MYVEHNILKRMCYVYNFFSIRTNLKDTLSRVCSATTWYYQTLGLNSKEEMSIKNKDCIQYFFYDSYRSIETKDDFIETRVVVHLNKVRAGFCIMGKWT